jgi:hypothetical protein
MMPFPAFGKALKRHMGGGMSGGALTPAQIIAAIAATSPLAWWDAGRDLYTDTGLTTPVVSDGDAVAGWKDQGSTGAHITQSTVGNRFVYRARVAALNNKPAVQLTAASTQYLSRALAGGIVSNLNFYNLIIVYRSTMVGTGYLHGEASSISATPLMGGRLATAAIDALHRSDASVLANPSGGATANDGSAKIYTLRRISAANFSIRLQGAQVGTAVQSPGTTTETTIAIGVLPQATPLLPVTAHIAQVLLYGAEQYTVVEPLLAALYGITLP